MHTSLLRYTRFRAQADTSSVASKDLHNELAVLDQDTVDTKSLDKVKVQLINGGLLLGKDRGVKAYTCCCLADLLRLYAPDCPYEDKELKVGILSSDLSLFLVKQDSWPYHFIYCVNSFLTDRTYFNSSSDN